MKKFPDLQRSSYHHGELRSSLIEAADAIIREAGIEGFSLRAAARRAGVTPGAPAHHFGNAAGLLTHVAVQGYQALGEALSAAPVTGNKTGDVHALATAYIMFALENAGRFRLMFRHDLVDRSSPLYRQESVKAFTGFAQVIAAYHDIAFTGTDSIETRATIFTAWSTVHGIAHLAIEHKMPSLFREGETVLSPQALLPLLLEAQWPCRVDAGDAARLRKD